MKNRLSALGWLALLACSLFPVAAHAQATASHWVYDPVLFQSHNTSFSTVAGSYLDDGSGTLTAATNAFDSLYASGIAKFDTTKWVKTAGWAPSKQGSAVDSSTIARLFIFDAGPSVGLNTVTLGRTSATAESIYVKTQVSPNATDWFDCAVIPGQSPVLNAFTVQTTVNAGVLTWTASQNTGISGKMWSLRYVDAQSAVARKDAIDINSITEFPFVRWIIMGSRTLNHAYKCSIGHLTTNASTQP